MLRHQGKGRTFSHNLKLASLLSAVAGIVNLTSLLAFNRLTTNVTGHFAFLSEQVFLHQYGKALVFLLFILCFFSGAFLSSCLVERISRHHQRIATAIPLLLEIIILLVVAPCSPARIQESNFLAGGITCLLLFAMGLQNALVTKVSASVVRTTHLTGLFTDLGIDISHWVMRKKQTDLLTVRKNIILKLVIIACFFGGGIVAGIFYRHIWLKTLYLSAGILCIAVGYDWLLFRYYALRRRRASVKTPSSYLRKV